jgi:histidyl-tRNA synthetase
MNQVFSLLEETKIPFSKDFNLVRGLDYYTGIIFEIKNEEGQAMAGGGRYDELYKKIGGKDYPAIGFALGVERMIDQITKYEKNFLIENIKRNLDIFFIVENEEFLKKILL